MLRAYQLGSRLEAWTEDDLLLFRVTRGKGFLRFDWGTAPGAKNWKTTNIRANLNPAADQGGSLAMFVHQGHARFHQFVLTR